jgi:hypothetical protein
LQPGEIPDCPVVPEEPGVFDVKKRIVPGNSIGYTLNETEIEEQSGKNGYRLNQISSL